MHTEISKLTHDTALRSFNAAAASLTPPLEGNGKGIVIAGGGRKYFVCLWVCINMLRRHGCQLPVDVWHLGPEEMNDPMKALIEPLGVVCIDALEIRQTHPARILTGWELKPYAILHSRFREVLLLDADNVPVVDPAFLFDTPEYLEKGAIFWPDYGRFNRGRKIWELTGIAYRDEPEFESGQIVINKARCWRPLSLAMWLNEHSDFWYKHIYGDKDTFHLAWRKLDAPYAMPAKSIHSLPGIMCQHDFSGRRIFQHRNGRKWQIDGHNPRTKDFYFEEECLQYLSELQQLWKSRPGQHFKFDRASDLEKSAAQVLCSQKWMYQRVGHDERPMAFGLDGRVIEGAAGCEQIWNIVQVSGTIRLHIMGRNELTCELINENGVWRGRWLIHERMPIELKKLILARSSEMARLVPTSLVSRTVEIAK